MRAAGGAWYVLSNVSRLSERTQMSLSRRAGVVTPSATLALVGKARKLREAGRAVLHLGAGEPCWDTPDFIKEAAMQALREGLTKYTPTTGLPELREAIAQRVLARTGAAVSPDQVIVSSGAKQSLFLALQALVDPGDDVLLPRPCWVSYPEMIQLLEARPVFFDCSYEEAFLPSEEALEKAVTAKTRAVILNSPSNPTGIAVNRERLKSLARFVEQRGLWLISDEVYEDLLLDETHAGVLATVPEIAPQSVVISGASKGFSMTGWRIGFAVAPPRVVAAMARLQDHQSSAPNSFAQKGAAVAFREGDRALAEFAARLRRLWELAAPRLQAAAGLRFTPPNGAFYVFPDVSAHFGAPRGAEVIGDAAAFCDALLEAHGVTAVPGDPFGEPRGVRLCFAREEAELVEGLKRLQAFCSELAQRGRR